MQYNFCKRIQGTVFGVDVLNVGDRAQLRGQRSDSRGVLGHVLLEGDQLLAVLVVQPLHFEVQVHIICTLAQPVLLML